MRFYAGVPLITNDKLVLGALCILDKTPRQLSLSQKQALQALAHQVVLQIELRHKLLKVQLTIDSLGESERRFRVIADASPYCFGSQIRLATEPSLTLRGASLQD